MKLSLLAACSNEKIVPYLSEQPNHERGEIEHKAGRQKHLVDVDIRFAMVVKVPQQPTCGYHGN